MTTVNLEVGLFYIHGHGCRSLKRSPDRPRGRRHRRRLRNRPRHRRGFAAFGAKVAIWERHADTAAAAAEEVGGSASPSTSATPAEVDAALERTAAELGPVQHPGQQRRGRVLLAPPRHLARTDGTPCTGRTSHVILCTQRVARGLVEHGLGAASSASPPLRACAPRRATRPTPRPRPA